MSESNAINDTGSFGNAHLPPNMSDAEAWAVYGLRVAMNLAHETATKAGWYNDPATGRPIKRNFGEVIALMTSELSEALEADRKSLMDDKLPHRSGVEVELADYFIRVSDTAMARNDDLPTALIEINRLLKVYSLTELRFALGLFQSLVLAAELGYDLAGAIVEKNRFNQTRKDHKLENRAAGGKKY